MTRNANTSHNVISGPIPDPPVFSTKFTKFTVPPYFSFQHAETQWLLNVVRTNSWDKLWRVALTNPEYFSQTYVQIPDCPDKDSGDPMFHKRAILYLTPFGLAIYMRKHLLVKRMLEFRSDNGVALIKTNQHLYVANVFEKDPLCSDLHVIFPFCILFRRESFESIRYFLNSGWNSDEGFILPYRRLYRLFLFEYKDFLDYCVAQMTHKPNLRLPNLIYNMIISNSDNFSIYNYEQVQVEYKNEAFVDCLSYSRRMFRYLYYFDRDLRNAGQIIRCIKIFHKFNFFNNYCNVKEILYQKRSLIPKHKQDWIIFDQDCCIALMLGIFYRAICLRHNQTQEKLLELIVDILIHVNWYGHFLATDPEKLILYFENLVEKVQPLKSYLFDIIKQNMMNRIKNNNYHKSMLNELIVSDTTKLDWENAIENFIKSNKNSFMNDNPSEK